MNGLLDILLNKDGLDYDTANFLLEALVNSDEADWPDILEPFVKSDKALEMLKCEPDALLSSQEILTSLMKEKAGLAARLKASDEAHLAREEQRRAVYLAVAKAFLEALDAGVLQCLDVHGVARCARLCSQSRMLASAPKIWEPRIQLLYVEWGAITCSSRAQLTPRDLFYSLKRPRFDGIYISECGYNHPIRFGCYMDFQKNAEEYKSGRKFMWCDYRRYLLLFPKYEKAEKAWALVLQSTCHYQEVEDLFRKIDPCTHKNPNRSVNGASRNERERTIPHMTHEVFAGRYSFDPELNLV